MLLYIPKKSKELYNEKIAHRGFHYFFPENTIPAYKDALDRDFAIELDIRMTKDKKIVCIHDRHTKRLLGKKGKSSNMLYDDILKYNVKNSEFKVPTLSEVFKLVNGRKILLIEVKGFLNNEFKKKLKEEVLKYDGKVYFHAKNIVTYFILRKMFNDRAFWILNPFRKRFNFIKEKQYRFIKNI